MDTRYSTFPRKFPRMGASGLQNMNSRLGPQMPPPRPPSSDDYADPDEFKVPYVPHNASKPRERDYAEYCSADTNRYQLFTKRTVSTEQTRSVSRSSPSRKRHMSVESQSSRVAHYLKAESDFRSYLVKKFMARRESLHIHKYSRFESGRPYESSESDFESSDSDCDENRAPPKLPPRRYEAYTNQGRPARPACGVGAHNRRRLSLHALSTLPHTHDISSSAFETTGDTGTTCDSVQDYREYRDFPSLGEYKPKEYGHVRLRAYSDMNLQRPVDDSQSFSEEPKDSDDSKDFQEYREYKKLQRYKAHRREEEKSRRLSEMYAPIRRQKQPNPPSFKPPMPPQSPIRLSRIEEIHPLVPDPYDEDLPNVPPLQLNRDWREPQLNYQQLLPKTNPHHVKQPRTTTARRCSRRKLPMFSYNQIAMQGNERPESGNYYDGEELSRKHRLESPVSSSLFEPENYGLNRVYAKNVGIKGILYLTITMCGNEMVVEVQNAVFFNDPTQTTQVCSYVRLEIKSRDHHRESRKRHSTKRHHQRSSDYRTRVVPTTNRPEFHESFKFNVDDNRSRGLSVRVYAISADNLQRNRLLGCMLFSISKLTKKSHRANREISYFDGNVIPQQTVVSEGGFFLLDPKEGEKKNFPQTKINAIKYYDDPMLCGMTSSSSLCNLSAQGKVMRDDDWRALSSNSSSTACYATERFMTKPRTSGSTSGSQSGESITRFEIDQHPDFTSASSTTSFADSAGISEYSRPHRMTLPAITTSACEATSGASDFTSVTPPPHDVDFNHLYADGVPSRPPLTPRDRPRDSTYLTGRSIMHKPPKVPRDRSRQGSSQGTQVRRAASFTYSPKNSVLKNNARPQSAKDEEVKREKKFNFGPISKTISYIRNKVDTALSTSSLYPSRDEVRQWETSFETLLNHKFGCALFRQFLKKEFSDENVDFWLECEEFKKLKDGKKETQKRAYDIYKEYVEEQSPKEVNLDSDTRAATKAALESGCKTDTFCLAQSRIEQLMAKDSYRRFLKDRLFLDFVEGFEDQEKPDDDKKANGEKERVKNGRKE